MIIRATSILGIVSIFPSCCKYSEFLRKRVQLSPVQIFINLKFIYLLVQSLQIYFLCHIGVPSSPFPCSTDSLSREDY